MNLTFLHFLALCLLLIAATSAGAQPSDVTTTTAATTATTLLDLDPLAEFDTDMLQIAIEAMVVEVNEDRTRAIGVNYALDLDDVGQAVLQEVNSGVVGVGATFGDLAIGDFGTVIANVRALVDAGDAEIRTRPMAVALNNTEVEIVTADEIPYQDVDFDPKTGRPQLRVSFEKVGVILRVLPKIIEGEDNRRIELDIRDLQVSGVSNFVTVREVSRPVFVTSHARTNVVLHNSETLVIGGLKTKRNSTRETGIPLLMRIPWLGWLFRFQEVEEKSADVLFIVAPHILPPGANPILPFDFTNKQIVNELIRTDP